MRLFLFGISAALLAAIPVTVEAKTVAQCNAEYASNRAAIRASGEKKRDFITRCRADTAAATAPLSANEKSAAAPGAQSTAPAPQRRGIARATRANEFGTEAEAKAHCPGDTVVWANTRTHVYHFPGSRNYGTTRSGAYVCEKEAGSLGIRAARNERRPTG